MAELLPTVFSDSDDDEDGVGRNEGAPGATNGGDDGEEEGDDTASASGDDDSDESDDGREGSSASAMMDPDFSFGGLAAADGGEDFDDAFLAATGRGRGTTTDWSYRSALDLLTRNDDDRTDDNNNTTIRVERTEVSSIVAAARSNLLRRRRRLADGDGDGDGGRKDDDDDAASSGDDDHSSSSSSPSADGGGAKDAGAGGGEASNDDGSGDDSGESSDSEEDDDEEEGGAVVDDADRQDMEEDVVRERTTTAAGEEGDDDADKRGKRRKKKKEAKNEEGGSDVDYSSDSGSDGSDEDGDDEEEEEAERRREAEKAAAFFDRPPSSATGRNIEDEDDDSMLFSQLNLSRPLLRAVARMGYVSPTPVQRRTVPVVLSGRDVAVSAVTGSGKTAAFLLPILERVLQRKSGIGGGGGGGGGGAIRGLILTPTRELAAQCLSMIIALTSEIRPSGFVRGCLVVGGSKNVSAQAAELRSRPDVVCATPGRLIDHLTNSRGVHLDDLDFLVLDEADRLVDMGFVEEVKEIVRCCPVRRQTLLFSATMDHAKVDDLTVLALKRPIRIDVSAKRDRLLRHHPGKNDQNGGAANGGDDDGAAAEAVTGSSSVEVAPRLEQEFVRVRSGNEGVHREAMLLSLLTRSYNQSRVIVFFDTKVTAHRLRILCGLCGIRCSELHGDLTQVQRLEALEAFREGDVDVLLATDLAGRGIDVKSVDAVLNFEMPSRVSTYVHRIGRCARAGRSGRSCTLIGEGRRHLMKEVIRDARERSKLLSSSSSSGGNASPAAAAAVVRSRTIPPAVVAHFAAKIASLEPHVEEVLTAEKIARMDRLAEMEAARAENIIKHGDEIKSRPAREWFATSREREVVRERAAAEARKHAEDGVVVGTGTGTGTHRMTRKKRRAREAREELARVREEMLREAHESGKKGRARNVVTDRSIKSSVRAQKKQAAKIEKESYGRSVQDDDIARVEKKRMSVGKDKQKKKRLIASDTLGSGGLFDEEKVSYAPAKKARADSGDRPAPSNYNFRGYDPDKKFGKGGKKGNKAFKSKSKYKRR